MPLYAMYYFGKAVALRPYDARMWCAMAECYEKVGNVEQAIKCYQRAEANNDREGLALKKLAQVRLFLANACGVLLIPSVIQSGEKTRSCRSILPQKLEAI